LKKKHSFGKNYPPTFSFRLYIVNMSVVYASKKMSNLYSDGELCYLPMLIVFIVFLSFPFNVVLCLTYNRCTHTCSKTASMFYHHHHHHESNVRLVVVVVIVYFYLKFYIGHPLKVKYKGVSMAVCS
jgi:hypothetical protein